MSVVVSCRCGKQFQAQPQLYGMQVACPACGGALLIPHGETPGLTPLPAPDPLGAPACAPTGPLQPQKPVEPQVSVYQASLATDTTPQVQYKRRNSANIIWIIVAIVIGLFLIVGGGVVYVGYRVVAEVQEALENEGVLPVADQDFATAYRNHNTELISLGPAPQDYDPLTTPRGAVKLPYVSKRFNHNLTAYVDPDPGDGKRHPAVIFLHGGFAFGEEDWTSAKPFRDAGYIVMTPVLRAENGQEGEFTLYHFEVDDVLGAIESLKRLKYVDTKKLFITGHSAGGTLATLTAMISNDLQGATSLCGCMDQTLNADIAPYPMYDVDEISIRSPVAYAASLKCPARLYYGTQEYMLSTANELTAARAQEAGLDVQSVAVAGDHFTAVPVSMSQSLQFFNALGGPPSSYSPGSIYETPSAPTNVAPPSVATPNRPPNGFAPPDFGSPFTPPEPPKFEPPKFERPGFPSRVGPSRVGPPSRVSPARPGIPSRVSPARPGSAPGRAPGSPF